MRCCNFRKKLGRYGSGDVTGKISSLFKRTRRRKTGEKGADDPGGDFEEKKKAPPSGKKAT